MLAMYMLNSRVKLDFLYCSCLFIVVLLLLFFFFVFFFLGGGGGGGVKKKSVGYSEVHILAQILSLENLCAR